MQHDDFTILNIYALIARASTSVKETLLKFKIHIGLHTLIAGDCNPPLSPTNRSLRQTRYRERAELPDFVTQMNLIQIYRTFYTNTPHKSFSKGEHIFGHKMNLISYKKIEITLCILSDHYGLKLNINNNKINRKPTKCIETKKLPTE